MPEEFKLDPEKLARLRGRMANVGAIADQMSKDAAAMGGSGTPEDEFRLEVDEKGRGEVRLRCIPAPEPETKDFISLSKYWWDGPGGKYRENCRSTIGESDPMQEANKLLWDEWRKKGQPEDLKDYIVKRMPRSRFCCNVLILAYPRDPSLVGKVLKWWFPATIRDMIVDAASQSIEPFYAFDMEAGADLHVIRTKKDNGFVDYKGSKWVNQDPLKGKNGQAVPDSVLQSLWGKSHALAPLIAEDKFRPYDELASLLAKAEGKSGGSAMDDDEIPF